MQEYCEKPHANKDARDEDGRIPLHLAARCHLSVVQYLCEQGADKEARNDGGSSTPLLWAAREGHLSVVQYLCEQGADKGARNSDDRAPLHSWVTLPWCSTSKGCSDGMTGRFDANKQSILSFSF